MSEAPANKQEELSLIPQNPHKLEHGAVPVIPVLRWYEQENPGGSLGSQTSSLVSSQPMRNPVSKLMNHNFEDGIQSGLASTYTPVCACTCTPKDVELQHTNVHKHTHVYTHQKYLHK